MNNVIPMSPVRSSAYYVLYENSALSAGDYLIAKVTNLDDAMESAQKFIKNNTDGKSAVAFDKVKVVYTMDGFREVTMWQHAKAQ